MGKQVTSRDELIVLDFRYSGDYGYAEYDPKTNSLDFHDLDLFKLFDDHGFYYSRDSFYDGILVSSTEDLTIKGTAKLFSKQEVFHSDGKLTFTENCDITAESRAVAFAADKVAFAGGQVKAYSTENKPVCVAKAGHCFSIAGNLIRNRCASGIIGGKRQDYTFRCTYCLAY